MRSLLQTLSLLALLAPALLAPTAQAGIVVEGDPADTAMLEIWLALNLQQPDGSFARVPWSTALSQGDRFQLEFASNLPGYAWLVDQVPAEDPVVAWPGGGAPLRVRAQQAQQVTMTYGQVDPGEVLELMFAPFPDEAAVPAEFTIPPPKPAERRIVQFVLRGDEQPHARLFQDQSAAAGEPMKMPFPMEQRGEASP